MCKLRAGLSRAANADQYILGNPKAWLGTACHAVLEGVVGLGQVDGLEARVREMWEAAIEREYRRACTHQLDRRFGPPQSWPGYHVVAAMALIRAKELTQAGANPRNDQHGVWPSESIREKKFSAAKGKIVGRPDLVRSGEVVDFKSGEIFEDEAQEQIKASYIRQLRIYGFLVRETLGWWPRRGLLLPMIGSPVEVDLEPGDCEKEAAEAVHLLEGYNAAIAVGLDPVQLASPSATTCRWCPLQMHCPAFWVNAGPEWAGDLGADAVGGLAEEQPSPIHNGLALSLSIRVDRGTAAPHLKVTLFPLDPSIHPDVTQVKAGDRLRVTGLFRRADDSLVAAKRTLIALEQNLPRIEVEPKHANI